MKPVHVIALLITFAVAAVSATLFMRGRNPEPPLKSISPTVRPEQVFDVRGQIISVDQHSGIVRIAHEEIPNYMPAMTMPFMVRDSNSLRALKPGDTVNFKLAVTIDDSWISEIKKSSAGPAPATAVVEEDTDDTRLKSGERVPGFGFIDQNGGERSFSEFSGKFVVLTFIYTRCPLPNFCPLLNKKFSELESNLGKEFPGKFHLLSVSIDPAYDTPQVLKTYAENYNADPSTWTFATGSPEQVAAIAELFGLTHSEKTPGLIDHDMRTALISPEGRVIHIWKSNFWTPYEIRNRIADHVHEKDLAAAR